MKVTLQRYRKNTDFSILYGQPVYTVLTDYTEKPAAGIMEIIEELKNNNDCTKFTPYEIIKIED